MKGKILKIINSKFVKIIKKIINFKYLQFKNKTMDSSKSKKKLNMFKKLKAKLQRWFNSTTDKLYKSLLNIIKLVLEIDIMPFFIFIGSFAISINYPWEYRALASIGIYFVYKMIIKDLVLIFKKNNIQIQR